jgi:multiple sugar transport system permease protein
MADDAIAAPATQTTVRHRWRLPHDWLGQTAMGIALVIGAFIMLVPFVWMFATSLSRKADISMPRTPSLWPPDPSLFNYKIATDNLPIIRLYFNSLVVVGATTAGYLFFCSLAGYAFAKGRFPGKSVLFVVFLATLFIPFETRMIPLYLFMNQLHLS